MCFEECRRRRRGMSLIAGFANIEVGCIGLQSPQMLSRMFLDLAIVPIFLLHCNCSSHSSVAQFFYVLIIPSNYYPQSILVVWGVL